MAVARQKYDEGTYPRHNLFGGIALEQAGHEVVYVGGTRLHRLLDPTSLRLRHELGDLAPETEAVVRGHGADVHVGLADSTLNGLAVLRSAGLLRAPVCAHPAPRLGPADRLLAVPGRRGPSGRRARAQLRQDAARHRHACPRARRHRRPRPDVRAARLGAPGRGRASTCSATRRCPTTPTSCATSPARRSSRCRAWNPNGAPAARRSTTRWRWPSRSSRRGRRTTTSNRSAAALDVARVDEDPAARRSSGSPPTPSCAGRWAGAAGRSSSASSTSSVSTGPHPATGPRVGLAAPGPAARRPPGAGQIRR